LLNRLKEAGGAGGAGEERKLLFSNFVQVADITTKNNCIDLEEISINSLSPCLLLLLTA